MLTLNNLSSPKGANKNTKRIGRGQGSGWGTQAGKGHKGQKARKSGHVRTGFEGGAMPLYKRLPKRGFSNYAFKNEFVVVKLSDIDKKVEGSNISKEHLLSSGLIRKSDLTKQVKIIGCDKITRAFSVDGIERVTKGAALSIVDAGGKIVTK